MHTVFRSDLEHALALEARHVDDVGERLGHDRQVGNIVSVGPGPLVPHGAWVARVLRLLFEQLHEVPRRLVHLEAETDACSPRRSLSKGPEPAQTVGHGWAASTSSSTSAPQPGPADTRT